jgi:hypothetical protein
MLDLLSRSIPVTHLGGHKSQAVTSLSESVSPACQQCAGFPVALIKLGSRRLPLLPSYVIILSYPEVKATGAAMASSVQSDHHHGPLAITPRQGGFSGARCDGA